MTSYAICEFNISIEIMINCHGVTDGVFLRCFVV